MNSNNKGTFSCYLLIMNNFENEDHKFLSIYISSINLMGTACTPICIPKEESPNYPFPHRFQFMGKIDIQHCRSQLT